MNKKTQILIVVTFLLVVIRIIFDKDAHLTYIVASINMVAFCYICSSIFDKCLEGVLKRIEETKVPPQIIERTKKEVRKKFVRIGFIPVFITILIFLIVFYKCSNLKNDIVAILALFISIIDEDVCNEVIEAFPLNSK